MLRRDFIKILATVAMALLLPLCLHAQASSPVTVKIQATGKPISPDLFGVFFEDLNYAADGGLYAELVQNRSFEYSVADRKEWSALTSWELIQRNGADASIAVEESSPLNARNPHYAVLTIKSRVGEAGLRNGGFDGITVQAGQKYKLSLFARRLEGNGAPFEIRLERKNGGLLAAAELSTATSEWKKYTATLTAREGDNEAHLVLLTRGQGRVALDMISLFPENTFRQRPNGLRADLAQTIADLHPKFIRFPGGCIVHGDGLSNMYRWKDTIGPIEQRAEQRNIWQYHQSVGLGYFEYFQFAEDIGAKPLPVVAAAVSCQNSGAAITHKWGLGQEGLPMAQMADYVQDVLDLIEYANGPVTSKWGAKRAEAGHPEPFFLQYLGLGNEDAQTDAFRERFKIIYEAVKAKHPEIMIVGTVGPFPDGEDFEAGWKFANEQHLEMVDEHGYKPPQWYFDHLNRFDAYDRNKSTVYLGEYAAHDEKKRSTLRSALAEAAYMVGLERNGDVVRMASYAPLLAKLNHTNWTPDLIYFSNTKVFPTINYHVQQLFARNSGDIYYPYTSNAPEAGAGIALSAVQESSTGDLILKVVNYGNNAKPLHLELPGGWRHAPTATLTLLSGEPTSVNDTTSQSVLPKTSTTRIASAFDYVAPANSLTVIRAKSR